MTAKMESIDIRIGTINDDFVHNRITILVKIDGKGIQALKWYKETKKLKWYNEGPDGLVAIEGDYTGLYKNMVMIEIERISHI